jgi:AmmeMemoRadiSam system protein B
MNRKRIFLIGPSHHYYLSGAATTGLEVYRTPLGDLNVDRDFVSKIAKEWDLEIMSRSVDEEEHSLEMHLPYIYKMLSLYHPLRRLSPLFYLALTHELEITLPQTSPFSFRS